MKIAIFGANGAIGSRITEESLERGHEVTALVRDPDKLKRKHDLLSISHSDILNPLKVESSVAGHDVVFSAFAPRHHDANELLKAAQTLLEGMRNAGVSRVYFVGGAGSLEVAPGVMLMDGPEFPGEWHAIALAHRNTLEYFRTVTDIDWVYISPAILIFQGMRTGHYRLGGDTLLKDRQGQSRISMEDYAVALVDVAEKGEHHKTRVSVAY